MTRSRWGLALAWVLGACASESVPAESSAVAETPAPTPAERAVESPPDPTTGGGGPKRLGKVTLLVGRVTRVRGSERLDVVRGTDVAARDRLLTGAEAKVQIKLADGSLLAVGPESAVVVSSLELSGQGRKAEIRLEKGRFWAQIAPWTRPDASVYTFETPDAAAMVRGTTLWADTEADAICVFEGEVEVTSRRARRPRPKKLRAGQCATRLSKGKTKRTRLGRPKAERYRSEVLIRP